MGEFETLDEFKADIRKKLTERAQAQADRKFEDEIIKKAVDNAQCDIPEVMVNRRLDAMLNQFDLRPLSGMSLESHLKMMGMEESKLRRTTGKCLRGCQDPACNG